MAELHLATVGIDGLSCGASASRLIIQEIMIMTAMSTIWKRLRGDTMLMCWLMQATP